MSSREEWPAVGAATLTSIPLIVIAEAKSTDPERHALSTLPQLQDSFFHSPFLLHFQKLFEAGDTRCDRVFSGLCLMPNITRILKMYSVIDKLLLQAGPQPFLPTH